MTEVSRVVHVRGVNQSANEEDFQLLSQGFGHIEKFVHIRAKHQVLMQFEDLQSAVNFVQHYSADGPIVRGTKVQVQFSSHQELTNQEGYRSKRPSHSDGQESRILLVTVLNPLYPITVDVLHQVFSLHGYVEKIVIFSKPAGLQALVQYREEQNAVLASSTLQGRNIYDGCCTLDIQYSNLDELHVNFNNERTRDFTNSQLPPSGMARGNGNAMGPAGSPVGPGGAGGAPGGGGGYIGGGRGASTNLSHHTHHQQDLRPGIGGYMHHQQHHQHQAGGGMHVSHYQSGQSFVSTVFGPHPPPGISGTNDRPTLLVSNFNTEATNHDKLFHLFSCYGNVQRIKVLYNKPDHALVEMADPFQAELALTFLRGITLFGNRLDVTYSKHIHISPSPDNHEYTSSPLNRFSRPTAKSYRHCCSPTPTLHCSSLPADVTEDSIKKLLEPFGTVEAVKVYDKESKKQAHVRFSSAVEATEALVTKHGSDFNGSLIRLAFSKNSQF